MDLPNSLLKKFAKVTNDTSKTPSKNKETSVYGTVVTNNSKTYVRFDGTDVLTPVAKAMDAQDGDRVLVTIKNHTATITGNISSPASARTATNFMKLTKDGLLVGELNEYGKTVGASSLIAPGTYYILDEYGNVLASFSGNLIKLGDNDSSEISLCNGVGDIRVDNNVLVLYGEKAVGLRSKYRDGNDLYKSEAVCKANSPMPVASLQVYKEYDENLKSFVQVGFDGIALKTPNGKIASLNGSEILTSSTVLKAGVVTGKGVVKANSIVRILKEVSVPEGYYLAGIREVSTNHGQICHITSFYTHPTTNYVGARFHNISAHDITDLTVRIEWFALRTKATEYTVEDTVTWDENDTGETDV